MTAGLLNTVAAFSLTAGGVGPLIALSFGLTAAPALDPLRVGVVVAIWIAAGLGLHLFARYLLGRLTP